MSATLPASNSFQVGQQVEVAPRTWAGINKPGGVGTIVKVHYSEGYIDCVDVKYIVVGGTDTRIDAEFIQVHSYLEKGGRSRRSRQVMNISNKHTSSNNNNNNNNSTTKKRPLGEHQQQSQQSQDGKEVSNKPSITKTKKKKTTRKETSAPTSSKPKKKKSQKDTTTTCTKKQTLLQFPKLVTKQHSPKETPLDNKENAPMIKKKKKKKEASAVDDVIPEGLPTTICTSFAVDVSPIPTDSTRKAKRKKRRRIPTVTPAAQNATTKTSQDKTQISKKTPSNKKSSTTPPTDTNPAAPPAVIKSSGAVVSNKKASKKMDKTVVTATTKPQTIITPHHYFDDHNNTAAAQTTTTTTIKRVALPKVYQNELENVNKFVKELVNDKTTKKHVVTGIKKNTNNVAVPWETVIDSSRQQHFFALFSELLQKNDGVFQEDQIVRALDQRMKQPQNTTKNQKPFTKKEVECCMEQLCAEDKIMVSDGEVYSIAL